MEKNTKEITQPKETKIAEKTLADVVQNRVNALVSEGRLNIPKDYSIGNALSSAWLILQQTVDKSKAPVLVSCTQASIANALLDMVILGLNPAKDQGYFIAYGRQLTWFTSYFGYEAAISRLKDVEGPVIANIIYEGDVVTLGENEYGEESVEEHERSWANKVKGVIAGAYADVMFAGKKRSAVMTISEIKEAWSKSQTDKDHKIFTGEFAKRTIKNRLMKVILKTSTDQDLFTETLLKTEQTHFAFDPETIIENIEEETSENTGTKKIPETVILDIEGENAEIIEAKAESIEDDKIEIPLEETPKQEKPKPF